jgi:adenylate kinase family enzyme
MIKLIDLLKEVQSSPKALLLAGAPGAGKGSILGGLNLTNIKTFNVDDTIIALSKEKGFTLNQKQANAEDRGKYTQAMVQATQKLKKEQIPQAINNKESFILDGTSASVKQTTELKSQLESAGYEVMMLYVYTDLTTSLERNQERFTKSKEQDRSLNPGIVLRTWSEVTKNFKTYQQMFGNNFTPVSNTGEKENIKDIEYILQTYVDPFRPTDSKPKTDKEIEKIKQLYSDTQNLLLSNITKEIIQSSLSKEQAQSKIKSFFNK